MRGYVLPLLVLPVLPVLRVYLHDVLRVATNKLLNEVAVWSTTPKYYIMEYQYQY